MTYTYNLSGAIIEQKYPSGRVVKNVLDNDGMISMIQSKKNQNTGYWNYAKNFIYTSAGAVDSMQLGNGKWESTIFNERLQPTQIALGTVQNGTDKLKLSFEYNTLGQNDNNGNILKQTIKVPDTLNATGFTATQTYDYDELNRLKLAEEKIDNVTSWKQTYTFDKYGNRRFDEANTDTLQSGCATAVCNPTIDPATNKLGGYTFDGAGNTEVDANGQTFTYDAENKQILVKDSSSNTVGEYFYDGDGKRVKKVVPNTGETTIFIYEASGKMVAEYSTIVETTQPRVSYLTQDHLGSPRITTDKDGDVYTRRDFMPFGEEIDSDDTTQRSVGLNYATDEIRQKFTSYERDNETELDFAQARYYSRQHGRFITVDPLMASAVVTVTQSWNRYSYALNNPLKYVDPTGEAFKDLTKEQLRVFQTYADKQNEGREKPLTAEEVYNGLTEDQQTTFESVTHALENSTVTNKKTGKSVSALSLVKGVTQITGQQDGKGGREQFRLLVDLKKGAIGKFKKSKEFNKTAFGKIVPDGHIYKDGKLQKGVPSVRQGGDGAKLQVSYENGKSLEADIDVDYRDIGKGHFEPYNSDVRAIGPGSGESRNNSVIHNQTYGKENPLRNIPTRIIPEDR